MKLHESYDDAHAHAYKVGGYVEDREKKYVRCESFCSVSRFCSQFNASEDS